MTTQGKRAQQWFGQKEFEPQPEILEPELEAEPTVPSGIVDESLMMVGQIAGKSGANPELLSMIESGASFAEIKEYIYLNPTAGHGSYAAGVLQQIDQQYQMVRVLTGEALSQAYQNLGFGTEEAFTWPTEEGAYTAEEALEEFGITIEEGATIQYIPGVDGGEPQLQYIAPEGTVLTQEEIDARIGRDKAEAFMWQAEQMAQMGQVWTPEDIERATLFSDQELLYQEYVRTGGQLEMEEWEQRGVPLRPGEEVIGGVTIDQIRAGFDVIFPETDITTLFAQMEI